MENTKIIRENYTAELEAPEIYEDNEKRRRSGHMSHAMAEFAPNTFIDFNSNCSAVLWNGHMPYGWVEYRISEDAGKTYSDIYTLQYSMDEFLDGVTMISVEKAVACFGAERIAVGVDALNGRVKTSGWEEDSGRDYLSFAEDCKFKSLAGNPFNLLLAVYTSVKCNLSVLGTPSRLSKIKASGKLPHNYKVSAFNAAIL